MKLSNKSIIKKYLFIAVIFIFIVVAILLMMKYEVEGEKNMPFELEKIIVKCSIDAENRESNNLWDVSLSQNNDIFIYIKQNENYGKEDSIKSVKIKNINFTKENKVGKVSVLLPTTNDLKTYYNDSTVDYRKDGFEYTGNTIDSMQKHEICENGGFLTFRVSNQEIGEYVSNEGTELNYNGSLLEKANISEEDLKMQVEMEICIETVSDKKYIATLKFDLPTDSFGDKGMIDKEITDFSSVVFKRDK